MSDTLPLAHDADVLAIHDDFAGVPWSFFLSGGKGEWPSSWGGRLNQTLRAVQTYKKPVFLTFQMLTGTLRSCPAQNASDGPAGIPETTSAFGCSQCWDFNTATNPLAALALEAFQLYAAFMVDTFATVSAPFGGLVAVNFAPEVNLGTRLCGNDWWQGVVSYSNSVYSTVKTQLALHGMGATPALPSIQLDALMGLQTGPDQPCVGMMSASTPPPQLLACIDAGLALVAPLKKDLFGVSTYPHTLMANVGPQRGPPQPWFFPTVLSRMTATDRAGFFIAETGFMSESIVVNLGNGTVGTAATVVDAAPDRFSARPEAALVARLAAQPEDPPVFCTTILNASLAAAADWATYVLSQAAEHGWPLVTWWSNTDLLWAASVSSCPCAAPPAFASSCTFITAYREIEIAALGPQGGVYGEIDAKTFAAMGVRAVDGTKREPLYSAVQAGRALPASAAAGAGSGASGYNGPLRPTPQAV